MDVLMERGVSSRDVMANLFKGFLTTSGIEFSS